MSSDTPTPDALTDLANLANLANLTGLTWRPIDLDLVPAWQRLLEEIADHDGLPERFDEPSLAEELAEPHLDPVRDTLLGMDDTGRPVAFSVVSELPGARTRRVQLWGGVAADRRRCGLGTALLGYQQARALALLRTKQQADPQLAQRPAFIYLEHPINLPDREKVCLRAGFEPVRNFHDLLCWLDGEPVQRTEVTGSVADSVVVRPWREADDEAVRLLHNDAFAAHFFSEPRDATNWRTWTTEHRSFRRTWSQVAEQATDTGAELVGYLAAHAHEVDWPALGHRQGWINLVGVRSDQRGAGVASAMLTRAMAAMASDGMRSAGLGVDTANASGALRLYTGLGFEVQRTSVMMRWNPVADSDPHPEQNSDPNQHEENDG